MEILKGTGAVALVIPSGEIEPKEVDEGIHHLGLFPSKMIGDRDKTAIFFPAKVEKKVQKLLSLLTVTTATA